MATATGKSSRGRAKTVSTITTSRGRPLAVVARDWASAPGGPRRDREVVRDARSRIVTHTHSPSSLFQTAPPSQPRAPSSPAVLEHHSATTPTHVVCPASSLEFPRVRKLSSPELPSLVLRLRSPTHRRSTHRRDLEPMRRTSGRPHPSFLPRPVPSGQLQQVQQPAGHSLLCHLRPRVQRVSAASQRDPRSSEDPTLFP